MKLTLATQDDRFDAPDTRVLPNDVDVEGVDLQNVQRVVLNFPKFTDGRAFSQAVELRRRRRFAGDIVATGDVLIDQVLQMKRCGFSEAVLRADQNIPHAEKLLRHFAAFYQGDLLTPRPHFARAA
jgi:uncharacterized protein (DUF934 family)